MIKTFGEWTIDVDIEATKQYYHNLQIEKEIIDFEEKCSTEEQSFLNELGVDTHKITLKQVQDWNNSDDTIMKKYKVQFLVVGTFKEMPYLTYAEKYIEITPGIDEITICYWLSYMYMLEGNDLLKEKYKKQMESICDNIEEALAFRNLGMIV